MTTATATGWAAYNEAQARLAAVIAEQGTNRYPTGTSEFRQLVVRYLAARADSDAALRATMSQH